MPDLASAAEGYQRLVAGRSLMDPTGATVIIGGKVLDHWLTIAKSPREKAERLKKVNLSLDAMTDPSEIWDQPNGNRLYLQVYVRPGKSGRLIGGVSVTEKGSLLTMFSPGDPVRYQAPKRGVLLYAR
jgi:hypothetical protein